MPNNVDFFAINADDVPRARAFYQTVFGWSFEPWGPPGFYLIDTGKEPADAIRGALQERRELAPGRKMIGFECTITVANIDRAIEAIAAAWRRRSPTFRPWALSRTSSTRKATTPGSFNGNSARDRHARAGSRLTRRRAEAVGAVRDIAGERNRW